MATVLARKAGNETPITTDDDHHESLANDPSVTVIPQGTTYDSFNTTANIPASGPTAFGNASTGGFGTSGGFGSSTTGYGGNTGFGSTTSGFGGSGFGSASTNNMGTVGTSNMNMSVGNQPVLTGAGTNAAQDANVLVANDNTDWINKKWRPVMGWMYMVVCVCDFTIFPILWSVLQALSHGQVTSQWQPVTLQGAGLFHVAMGAVLGIAAYGRTKEKIEGKS
jgi:hypothetical protein